MVAHGITPAEGEAVMSGCPLLEEGPTRYVLRPVYQDVYEFYVKARSLYWTPAEINLETDVKDWRYRLNDQQKHFIKWVLAFFAASDGIVNFNLEERFIREIKMPEAKAVYAIQAAIEVVHAETYSLLIQTLLDDNQEEQMRLFSALETIPSIKKKGAWALKWVDGEGRGASFAMRLLAFACVEGIFFSGAFCAIYWVKQMGVLPGLCFSNELISRDESLHTEFAILLYTRYVPERLSEKEAHALVGEAVEIESEFITEALPCSLLNMDATKMKGYIRFCADRLLVQLGYGKLYGNVNPFPFMERISLDGKSNFFERRVSEYSLGSSDSRDPSKTFEAIADF